jgi:two-component system, chemotaxis family, CheB/CheR fusion protein
MPRQKPKNPKKNTVTKRVKKTKSGGRDQTFPVVAIGASAGGAEAFSIFLQNLPQGLNMAYVYLQQRSAKDSDSPKTFFKTKSRIPIVEVKHDLKLKVNHIYFVPEGMFAFLEKNTFKIATTPQRRKTGGSAVDFFMTSMAAEFCENAIGILLSGTSSDGSLGLKAIREVGGITFAQDESAKYQGMSRHASDADLVDFILPPDRIAKELAALVQRPDGLITPNELLANSDHELKKILALLYNKRGVDFYTHYKQTTIYRRIMRRMHLNGLSKLTDYTKKLRQNIEEVEALYNDLLINVTSFFRDPHIYSALSKFIFPALTKDRKVTEPIRIWVPACATGEEACSIAIALHEFLSTRALDIPFQIFATDLNEIAIDKARSGIYHKSALINVSPERLKKYFIKSGSAYQIVKLIRDGCVFAPHNLLKDPPFFRMDLISCQNVFIYLEASPQKKILYAFHYALRSSGFLLLGKSETVGNSNDLFEQLNKDLKIYSKKASASLPHLDFSLRLPVSIKDHAFRTSNRETVSDLEIDVEKETDRLLLSRFVPPGVVVNKDLEILRFLGSTSKFLEPTTGKASLNLLKMVKSELVFDLRSLIYKVNKQRKPASKNSLHAGANGKTMEVQIEVAPIKCSPNDVHFLIVFRETPGLLLPGRTGKKFKKDPGNKLIQTLEDELREGRAQMKAMSEEFEATREELQSANEEVISSNEELQSINEELETSKEELQSSNEELTTINEELQNRNIELKESRDYVETIIQTKRGGLVVLTSDMRVKNANRAFYEMFRLSPQETEGNFLYEIGGHQWDIPLIHQHLREIFPKNIPFEEFELDHTFPKLGRKVLIVKVHKLFYNEGKEVMILLAMDEITPRKKAEEALRESEKRFHTMCESAPVMIWMADVDNRFTFFNKTFLNFTGSTLEAQIKNDWRSLIHPEDRETFVRLYDDAFRNRKQFRSEYRLRHNDGNYRHMIHHGMPLQGDEFIGFIGTCVDISDRIEVEKQKDTFLGIASHELKTPLTSIKAYAQILQDRFANNGSADTEQYFVKLDGLIDRLTNIINNLLDVSKLQTGRVEYNFTSFDINELLKELADELRPTAKHKLILSLDKPQTVRGDRERLTQVFTNLISNAIKYSPTADEVHIRSEVNHTEVMISVHDHGIGIPKQEQEKIFNRFYRVEEWEGHVFPGLGLGLFIAAEILKGHGGKINVESDAGKGAVFSVTLPLKSRPTGGVV